MINKITVVNHLKRKTEIDLFHPELSGLAITGIDGIGPGTVTINKSEIGSMDGGLISSSRTPIRNIQFHVIFLPYPTIEHTRHKCYETFPLGKTIDIMFETDIKKTKIQGVVESDEPNIFSEREGTTISILCPDPFFENLENPIQTSSLFYREIPMFGEPIEEIMPEDGYAEPSIESGQIITEHQDNIINVGSVPCGLVIKLHILGEIGDIVLTNLTTNQSMYLIDSKIRKIIGADLTVGDNIIIDTEKGNKSIRMEHDGILYNITGCLDRHSKWISLESGDNLFAYSTQKNEEALQMSVNFKPLYRGI